ncbi:hypothetical protein P3T76_011408 [Phytophthora citrophthora]|uniref:PDZ domain-containing protein n=1 Tax=Phytophthora citrophthora TaxID=4793 RepID=A0AAD9LF55_9STRA|nr:hypothetical protein P3T76_011408 [Phytophthora citrophthora]
MTRLEQPHAPTDADNMQDYLINWNAGPLGVVLRPDLGADMPPVVAQLLPQPSVLKMAGVREGDLLISVNGKKTTRLGYEKVVRLLFKERLPMVLHFRSPLQVQEMQRGVSGAIVEEPTSARGRSRSRTSSSARPPQTQTQTRGRGRSDVDAHALIEQKRNPNAQNFSIDSDISTKSEKKKKKKSKHKHKHGDKAEAEERRLRKQYSVVWERGSLGISFRAYNSKVNVPCVDFISAGRGQGRGMERVCVNDVLIAINGEKTKALGVEKVLRWLHVIEKPVVLRFHASSNRILNPAGGLLPHLADDEGDTSARPRRPTAPLPQTQAQPEYEPAPRPPRRNNSVDQPVPQQRTERGFSDDREYELQPAVAQSEARRYSRDSGTYFEKQPIDDYEPQYQFSTSKIEVKERRYSNNSMSAYAQGRDEDGVAGDFRREPMDADAPQFDLRIDAHIIPHRRQQQPNEDRFGQSHPLLLPPSRSRTSSASREDIRRQQQLENKPVAPPVVILPPAAARPRLASRDSQVSNSSHMSFDEAAGIVARATGKPMDECEFGGVPLMDIKDGTVQSKLMFIYAKACLAKEGSSDDEPAPKDPQPPRTPGNPLGRKGHSKYLSYTILQDDAVASNHISSKEDGSASPGIQNDGGDLKMEDVNGANNSFEYKRSGVFSDNLDESFAKMQKDISIQQPPPPMVTPPLSSVGPSSSVSSDATPSVSNPVTPAEDFISLKDFMAKGDVSLSALSLNSTETPVRSTDGVETDKTDEQQEQKEVIQADVEAVIEEVKEIKPMEIKETSDVVEEAKPTETKETPGEDTEQVAPVVEEIKEVGESTEERAKIIELVEEHVDEHSTVHEEVHVDDDDDAASIDSSNERDLAASVASLDDLLDLPLKDGNHDDEEHEEFVDDDDDEEEEEEEEEKEIKKDHADEKESMNTSLGMKLDQVQEEEAGDTEEQQGHGKHEKEEEHDEEEEYEDGALSNPIVNELFRNVADVREVIKDKPALVVLVKKSMIDEIQEILQSLQMELQFERHSTMAVGSTASPLPQQGRSTEGEHCYRCGATGELAELDVAGGQRELYCQECWEMFFFNDDRQSPVTRTSKTLAPLEAGRLTADEDALDEALKYSFHDSSVTREDMIHPWRYLQGSDSISSSIRDSNASSITDRADEVWL